MREPVVVCVAPNGARRSQLEHPAVPLTAAEIAHDAAACAEAGATVLHLHVRDADGRHSLEAERYRDAIAAVQAAVGDRMLIQVTTEAVGRYTRQEQMAVVRALVPDAASVALRELVPDASAEADAASFFAWARERHIGLQHIVYASDEVERLVELTRRGVVAEDAPHALFVLGRQRTPPLADPQDLAAFVAAWPPDWPWSVCAFGPIEQECLSAAVALGGHVRVGFENNLVHASGRPAKDNAENVASLRVLVETSGRALANASASRRIFGASARTPRRTG